MKIEVSDQEAQVVLAGIAKLPIEVGANVFQKVQVQVIEGLEASKSVSSPVDGVKVKKRKKL